MPQNKSSSGNFRFLDSRKWKGVPIPLHRGVSDLAPVTLPRGWGGGCGGVGVWCGGEGVWWGVVG